MDNLIQKIRGTENTKNTSGVTNKDDEKNNPGEFPTFDTLENSPEKSKKSFCTRKKVFNPHNKLISAVLKFNSQTVKINAIKGLAIDKVNGEIYVGVRGIETYCGVCPSATKLGLFTHIQTLKRFPLRMSYISKIVVCGNTWITL